VKEINSLLLRGSKGSFVRRESAEKVSAGVKLGGRLLDLSVFASTLTSRSGHPITSHRTSAEERGKLLLIKTNATSKDNNFFLLVEVKN